MRSLLFTCLTLAVATCSAVKPPLNGTYTGSKQLLGDYKIYWRVDETINTIYLGFEVKTTGWFGFGIAEPESGSMPGADIMVASVDDTTGVGKVEDRFSYTHGLPPLDAGCQNWVLIDAAQDDGWTVVEVKRRLDVNDTVQDRAIRGGLTPIIFSHGPGGSDSLAYHTPANRGYDAITFYGTPPQTTDDIAKDPTVTVAKLTLNNYIVPNITTTYMCQSFELPIDTARHIIAFEPVLESTDKSLLHHALIHGCVSDTPFYNNYKTAKPCNSPLGNAQSNCQELIFGWSRGGGVTVTPPQAGFRVQSGNANAFYRVVIQYHFNNPLQVNGAIENSGFNLYMTTKLRTYDAGMITMGEPFAGGETIPGNSPYTEYEYACSPTCTAKLAQPLYAFAEFLHMHGKGRSIWTSHWRTINNQAVQLFDNARTEYFAYDIQKNLPVNYTIVPGDRFNVHCAYDTEGYGPVSFGIESTQEMCMNFVAYYPKQNNIALCGAAKIATGNNVSLCGADYLQPYEPQNPQRWGFDDTAFHVRNFGLEKTPALQTCVDGTMASTAAPTSSSTTSPSNGPTPIATLSPTVTPAPTTSPNNTTKPGNGATATAAPASLAAVAIAFVVAAFA